MRLKQAYKQMNPRQKKAFFAKIKKFFQDAFGGNESKKALDMLQDIWKNRESFSREISLLRNDWRKYQREVLNELFSDLFMSPKRSIFAHILEMKNMRAKLLMLKKEINALEEKEDWNALRNVFTKELIPYVEKLQKEIDSMEKIFDDKGWDIYASLDTDRRMDVDWKTGTWLPYMKEVKGKDLSKKAIMKLGYDSNEAEDIMKVAEEYARWEVVQSTMFGDAADLIDKQIVPKTRRMNSTLSGLPDLENGLQDFLEHELPKYLKQYQITASAKDLGDYIKKNIDTIAEDPAVFGKDARKFFDMSKKLK